MSSRVEPPPYSTPQAPTLAPHSQEAEEALIGSMLIDATQFEIILGTLSHEGFYILRNAYIWEAMERLHHRGDPIELITVANELRGMRKGSQDTSCLELIEGVGYLSYTIAQAATAINGVAYGQIVARAAVRRQLLVAADQIASLARDENQETLTVYGKALTTIESIAPTHLTATGKQDATSLAGDMVDLAADMLDNPDQVLGIKTGYLDLDNLIGGLIDGALVAIGGRPGMGKSLFMGQMMYQISADYPVFCFQLEMTRKQMAQRWITHIAKINHNLWLHNGLTEGDYDKIVDAANILAERQITVDDTPGLSALDIRAKAKKQMAISPYKALFIDYLQFIRGSDGHRAMQRSEELALIVQELKDLAKELNIPVVTCAQVKQAVDNRDDKRPMLSDFGESDFISRTIETGIMLYRDDVYNGVDSNSTNQLEVIVVKNRNGRTGTVPFFFDGEHQSIRAWMRRKL